MNTLCNGYKKMNSKITFSKMQALGNDFMVINGVQQKIHLDSAQVIAWADRRRGVGFDQLLLIESTRTQGADFLYRIFNADGSDVGQCGNGARAAAQFIRQQKLSDKNKIILKTKNALIENIFENDTIKTNLGIPKFSPEDMPIRAIPENFMYTLEMDQGEKFNFYALNIGNPHVVIFVDDLELIPVGRIGSFFSNHTIFPESTNIEFVQVLQAHRINVRVFERGAGETESCGSGACAAAIANQLRQNKLDEASLFETAVHMPGGMLSVMWQGMGQPVWLSGDVATVFTGEISL